MRHSLEITKTETLVSRFITEVSGGEKQSVIMARTLYPTDSDSAPGWSFLNDGYQPKT